MPGARRNARARPVGLEWPEAPARKKVPDSPAPDGRANAAELSMRLACPNCGAEYEVPDNLVPEGGKHVQCTDCDTRWFVRAGRDAVVSEDQLIERLEKWRPRLVTTSGTAPGPTPADAAEPAATPNPEPEPRPSEPEPARAPEPVPATLRPAAVVVEDPTPAAAPAPTAPPPTDDAPLVNPAPDLSDDGPPEDFVWEDSQGAVAAPPEPARPVRPATPPPPPAPPAAAPVFRPVVAPVPSTAEKPANPETTAPASDADDPDTRPVRSRTRNSQRIVLPEDGARSIETPEPPAEPDRFRIGLLAALAFFFLALLVYATRDAIVATVPAVEPALSGYAGAVDGLREGIDRIVAPDG